MSKPIVLLTKPHTGTHTLTYLLAVLGGAEVYHCHVGKSYVRILDELLKADLEGTIVLYTQRDLQAHRESWLARYGNAQDFEAALSLEDRVIPQLPSSTVYLTIDAEPGRRIEILKRLCKEAEVEITEEMDQFIKEWPKMNARGGEEVELTPERAGYMSRAKRRRVPEYLRKYHGIDLKEHKNGT